MPLVKNNIYSKKNNTMKLELLEETKTKITQFALNHLDNHETE